LLVAISHKLDPNMVINHATMEMLLSSPQPAASPPEEEAVITVPEKDEVVALPDTATPSHGNSDLPRPSTPPSGAVPAVQARERWNKPRANTWRLAAIFFAFIVFGMNDASYGALVPYVCLYISSSSVNLQIS